MPDTRSHRGPHPEDARLFAAVNLPALQEAVRHFSWLLTKGYGENSSLKLVGDRFSLEERQRMAVWRASCADAALDLRRTKSVTPLQLEGRILEIDGFNLLMTIETALSRGVVLQCRDECVRDLAGLHGSYRKVEETLPAIELIAADLARWSPKQCHWWFDSPVSNSGRLATLFREFAESRALPWSVEVTPNPDAVLIRSPHVVVSADSAILDRCALWCNYASELVKRAIPNGWIVKMCPRSGIQDPP